MTPDGTLRTCPPPPPTPPRWPEPATSYAPVGASPWTASPCGSCPRPDARCPSAAPCGMRANRWPRSRGATGVACRPRAACRASGRRARRSPASRRPRASRRPGGPGGTAGSTRRARRTGPRGRSAQRRRCVPRRLPARRLSGGLRGSRRASSPAARRRSPGCSSRRPARAPRRSWLPPRRPRPRRPSREARPERSSRPKSGPTPPGVTTASRFFSEARPGADPSTVAPIPARDAIGSLRGEIDGSGGPAAGLRGEGL